MPEKEYITKEKYDSLVTELDHLKKVRRREVAENLEYAKSLGDLSENAEYHEARDMQASVEDRITKLESIIKNAVIVSSHDTSSVSVGSKITVVRDGSKEEKVYTIVGSEESDISAGKISTHSPFGQSVVGKKKGEKFTFNAPSGPITYKIIDIE